MGSLSNTYENALLDAVAGSGRAAGFPATYYLALFTADPGEAGVITAEVPNAGAYARLAIPNDTTNWPAAAGSTKSNALAKTFPTATANWGQVTHCALMSTAGHGTGAVVASSAVTPAPVNSGETAVFPVGSLVFNAD